MADTGVFQRTVLVETLRLAVPMHMAELHGQPLGVLAGLASKAATTIGSRGDDLQFGGRHCAQAFNALARGLAAAALTAEGGADYAGLHWCADPWCRAGSRFEHAPDVDVADLPEVSAVPAQRPVVEVQVGEFP